MASLLTDAEKKQASPHLPSARHRTPAEGTARYQFVEAEGLTGQEGVDAGAHVPDCVGG